MQMKTRFPIKDILTPHKHGKLVLAPSLEPGTFDSHMVDCPFPFFHDGRCHMTYVGWDGVGYRTGLAVSDDLVNWHKQGMILDRGPQGSATQFNVALTCILRDNELYGASTLKRVNGAFVGTYHAYPASGYEAGPAVIGLCRSDDLRYWQVEEPCMRPEPACCWEAGGLYKSWLMENDGRYYLFYNAKNRSHWPWIEQTGLAISEDLMRWERCTLNPLLWVGKSGEFDDLFASDPFIVRHRDKWVNFYFGNSSDGHARDGVAFSDDLISWEKSGCILVDVGPQGSLDSRHAHKAGIITRGKDLYHFYCAVAPRQPVLLGGVELYESRGITFASNTFQQTAMPILPACATSDRFSNA